MGGCATKPKVLKDQDHNTPEPLLRPDEDDDAMTSQPQAHEQLLVLHDIVVDDHLDHQSNRRPSLSFLFNQNEDVKANTRSEKSEAEVNVKEATSESEKQDCSVEGINEINEGVKQESLEAKDRFSEDTQSDNKAEKCEGNDIKQQEEVPTSASRDEPQHKDHYVAEDPKAEETSEEASKAQIGP